MKDLNRYYSSILKELSIRYFDKRIKKSAQRERYEREN
jgi:hypothetical protein